MNNLISRLKKANAELEESNSPAALLHGMIAVNMYAQSMNDFAATPNALDALKTANVTTLRDSISKPLSFIYPGWRGWT